MTEEQQHAIYRWTEFTAMQRKMEVERRHAKAILWGTLTAVLLSSVLVYLFG